MPHAVSKGVGLQALILCGPGSSFPTFTANPDESTKALLPIANRPMVWYPLDFCYRAGITNITLICPPSAATAIKTALKTNPFLTTLPAVSPAVLAPADLDLTTGTASLLRLPEVRSLVTGDFVVLPCDLVCELGGASLLEAWMVRAASLADLLGSSNSSSDDTDGHDAEPDDLFDPCRYHFARSTRHSGGLGVWYDTRSESKTKEETDFVATVPFPGAANTKANTTTTGSAGVLAHLERVVAAMPTDSLNDLTEEREGYPVRHGLLRRHRRVRMRTTHRDAHIYVFPQWVMDFVQANEHMDSIGEDVLGWWAKAGWQPGLPKKLGADKVLQTYGAATATATETTDEEKERQQQANGNSDDVNASSSTAAPTRPPLTRKLTVPAPTPEDRMIEAARDTLATANVAAEQKQTATAITAGGNAGGNGNGPSKHVPKPVDDSMPPFVAYVHPSTAGAPLIRRVDTSQLLLSVSLQLAKLPSLDEAAAAGDGTSPSPFAHAKKVAYPEGVKSRTTITRQDCLVAENVTVEEKVSIKECVIGANCTIHEGAKLHQCLLMEGVVVGKGCRLTRCILGRRSEIGAQSTLVDCEVQENLLVEPKTDEKDNNFMSSEGLEATEEDLDEEATGEEVELQI